MTSSCVIGRPIPASTVVVVLKIIWYVPTSANVGSEVEVKIAHDVEPPGKIQSGTKQV